MSTQSAPASEHASADGLALEPIFQRFEDAWRQGRSPAIDDYLPSGEPHRHRALIELIHTELEFRLKARQHARVEEYLQRYPELQVDGPAVVALITREYELRRRYETTLAPEEYLRRFPQYRKDILNRLQQAPAPSTPAGPGGPLAPVEGETAWPSTHDGTRRGGGEEQGFPTIPGYEVEAELGRGGMGVVYWAKQVALKRRVALKMILAHDHAGPEALARFRIEAEAVARLQHPNIVGVFEIGEDHGTPYLAMEYCEGGSLDQRLAGTSLPAVEAAGLVETLARAMHHAHSRGVVHRDLKPANVLLAYSVPKISDFGLAKLHDVSGQTPTGALVGTPCYMAPEQAGGRSDVGIAADVYALGAILYECLTGRPPFKAATFLETLQLVVAEEPVAVRQLQPGVPVDLETICHKCLHKDPARRYRTAKDLAEDLRRHQAGEPITARPVGLPERAVKWVRRKPAVAGLLAAAVLGLAGVVCYLSQQWRELHRQGELLGTVQSQWDDGKDAEAGGRASLALGREDEALDHFARAEVAMNAALATLDASSLENQGLRQQIAGRLEAVERQLEVLRGRQNQQRQREQARKAFAPRIEQLGQAREELLVRDLSVVDGEQASDQQAIRRLAPAALAPFGLGLDYPAAAGATALTRLEPSFASAQQRRQVAEWCCEVLLIWAETEAGRAPPGPAGGKPEAALWLLAQAEGLCRAHVLPTPRTLHERRARSLAACREADAAAAERDRAEKCPAVTALDHFLLGLDRYRGGDAEAAIRACEEALRLQPDYFWPLYLQALCYLQGREWSRAEERLSTFLTRREFFWARLQRAVARVEQKQPKDLSRAAEDLEKALAQAKGEMALYGVYVTRGRLAMVEGRWQQAQEDLRKAVKCQPKGAYQAHVNLAHVYQERKDLGAALTELDRAVACQPGEGRLYYTRARLQRERGELAAAREDFVRAVARGNPKGQPRWLASAYVELGYLKHRAGEYAAALADFDEALKVVRGYPPAYRQRAETLLALGRPDEAGRALDTFLATGWAEAEDYKARGWIHAGLREFPEAIQAYSKGLQIQAGKPDPELHSYRGWVYLQTQALALAQADFARVLKANPKHADALCGRGQVRVLLGEVTEALEDAAAALKHGRPTATLYCSVAGIHARAAQRWEEEDRRAGRRGVVRARGLEERAMGLIEEAVRRVPADGRKQFWRDKVEKEPAFRSLLRHPEMVRLRQLCAR